MTLILALLKSNWKLLSILILGLALWSASDAIIKYKKEVSRLADNSAILLKGSNGQLRLKKRELDSYIESSATLIKLLEDSLGIKNKRIEDLSVSTSKTVISIKEVLKDTTIYVHDTLVITAKSFKWADPWNSVSGLVYKDSVDVDITVFDTLAVVTHMTKPGKWFLPRIFQSWKLETEVANVNPNADFKIESSITRDR
jgi:hypothetical protein